MITKTINDFREAKTLAKKLTAAGLEFDIKCTILPINEDYTVKGDLVKFLRIGVEMGERHIQQSDGITVSQHLNQAYSICTASDHFECGACDDTLFENEFEFTVYGFEVQA